MGTGYNKSYVYDFRLDRQGPPPNFLEATDETGYGLFDIVGWYEEKPTKK